MSLRFTLTPTGRTCDASNYVTTGLLSGERDAILTPRNLWRSRQSPWDWSPCNGCPHPRSRGRGLTNVPILFTLHVWLQNTSSSVDSAVEEANGGTLRETATE